jgi:hypothetical protein
VGSDLEIDKALLAADVDVRTVGESSKGSEHGLECGRGHHRVIDRSHPQVATRLVPCVEWTRKSAAAPADEREELT